LEGKKMPYKLPNTGSLPHLAKVIKKLMLYVTLIKKKYKKYIGNLSCSNLRRFPIPQR
jgi:hypothetical protein